MTVRWMRCVQVSFANAICTTKGGTHVNYITDQVTKCGTSRIL